MTKRKPKLPKDDEVVALLNDRILVSSAVTLAPEEYIKRSASDFLTSYVLQKLGVVVVNEDAKNLEASMLSSSFQHPDDLTLILHGCVSSTTGAKLSKAQEDKLSVEEKNRRALEEQLHMCSLDEIIDHVKNSMGQPRISYMEKTDEAILAVLQSALQTAIVNAPPNAGPAPAIPTTKADKIGSFIRVTKPAEIDYRRLDFSHLTTDAALDIFLKDIVKYESGITDKLDIAIELFEPLVAQIFVKMKDWQELAIKEAKSSRYNNIQFEVVNDPWAALFSGLYNNNEIQSESGL